MSDFCSKDSRLMGVGVIPLHEPELAMVELDFAIKSGLEAMDTPLCLWKPLARLI